MRKPILLLTALIFFSNYLIAQNSMVGDGFGGRGWYVPHNYSAGAYSAYTVCGIDSQLYGWGSNIYGELGNATSISTSLPVTALQMTNVKFYTAGYISGAIKEDNTAWTWGSFNPPGESESGFTTTPIQVLSNVKFIDAGFSHIVFVKEDGTVWGAGQNRMGELGNGVVSTTPTTVPIQMIGINDAIRAVSAGRNGEVVPATIILLRDSTVKITGGGGWFRETNSLTPVILTGLKKIIDIKANVMGAYALDADGNVFAFGKNSYNSVVPTNDAPVLGLGNVNGIAPPTKIIFPSGAASIVALSANNDGQTCFALDSNKNVYAWGNNAYGQLGDGTSNARSIPVLIATNAIDIFAGENFTYILKSDNTLWATGQSGYSGFPSGYWGSIWINLPNIQRNVFTQIDPTIAPMNLCAPKVWGVVPIKLLGFTCVANGNNAVLNWQSAEETNASKYIVQYSNDGSNFKDIASVFTTGSNSKYNYIHQQVNGTAFYRLKMMDKDGSFKYSEIRVVKFNNKTGFTIAPSPADDVVYLFTKNNAIIKSIQIISVDGKVVREINNYNNGQRITISNLAKDVYILKAVYQNNEMEYRRFIKM